MTPEPTLLDTIALALAVIHFTTPLAYYYYLRKKHLGKSWGLTIDPGFQPKATIIIPTYMGAKYIASRLDNIHEQNYPSEKVEIIVVDSASPDRTREIVEEWIKRNPDVKTMLVTEPERHGKLSAVLEGLKHLSRDSEIVILTDDDCLWEADALKNAVKYFSDPSIGAVSGSIRYIENRGVNNAYREFYNKIRVAESKWWSTPVHNGPLLALRRSILDKIGLPYFPGADDSAFASYIAFSGYRAIQVDDVWVYEPVAERQHRRMVRRAIHLIKYFTSLKKYVKTRGTYVKTRFDMIWRIEAYLHVFNPFLLAVAVALLVASAIIGSTTAIMLLAIGAILLVVKPYRAWIQSQLYLLIAAFRSLVVREEAWSRS